jgi:hypothetical protein
MFFANTSGLVRQLPGGPKLRTSDKIDELLDEAAIAIPRATVILRKIAQFSTARVAGRRTKIGIHAPAVQVRKYK